MPYQRRVDRERPACFMFLLDQSYSMNEPVAGRPGQTKAQALADAINTLLYELVLRCIKNPEEGPRHYYDVGVVGYGATVGPVWGGALAGRDLVSIVEIGHHPLRVEQRDQSTVGGGSARMPIWFDPVADGEYLHRATRDHLGEGATAGVEPVAGLAAAPSGKFVFSQSRVAPAFLAGEGAKPVTSAGVEAQVDTKWGRA